MGRSPRSQATGRLTVGTLAYDELNRLTGKTYQLGTDTGATENVTHTYDQGTNARGRLTSVATPTTRRTYRYDAGGRTIGSDQVLDTATYTSSATYTEANLLKTLSFPFAGTTLVEYTYNDAGQMSGVTRRSNAGMTPLAANIQYAPMGGVTRQDLGQIGATPAMVSTSTNF